MTCEVASNINKKHFAMQRCKRSPEELGLGTVVASGADVVKTRGYKRKRSGQHYRKYSHQNTYFDRL